MCLVFVVPSRIMPRRTLGFASSVKYFLVALFPLACSSAPPPVDPPKPLTNVSIAVVFVSPPPNPCDLAAELRKKIKPFLDEGRLHRTVRLIEKADRLCPTSAIESHGTLVATLAELGKYEEARQLADQIEKDPDASVEAKAAAKNAKEQCDKFDKTFPAEGPDKEAMKKLYTEAMTEEQKADPESQKRAKEKFIAAWETWRPNGQALLSAGYAAKALGEFAEAQKLFDRAVIDAEKSQHAPVVLEVPNGFSGKINAVVWSKDGRRFAVAHDKELSIFDGIGREKFRLRGHSGIVTSAAFSPDSKTIVSGSADATIKSWDVATGNELGTFKGHTKSVAVVAYAPNGQTLVSGAADQMVKIWDLRTGQEIRTLGEHPKVILTVAYSPDGKTIVTAAHDKNIRVWNVATGKLEKTFPGPNSPMTSLVLAPNGKTVAVGSATGDLWELDLGTGKRELESTGQTGSLNALLYSPNGQWLAAASSDTVHLWDTKSKKNLADLQQKGDAVTALAYSPDGKILASGASHYATMIKLRLWDTNSRTLSRTIEEHSTYYATKKYSPDGRTFAVGFFDGTVRVWNVETGTLSRILNGTSESIERIDYSPDGTMIAAGSADKTIRLWNVETGRLVDKLEGLPGPVAAVIYSPDGKMIASYPKYGDATVYLWDATKGKLAYLLEGHRDSIYGLAFAPDGKTIASASRDQTLRIWNVADGSLAHELKGHQDVVKSVAYSPDGKTIASACTDGTARIWDVATGKHLQTFDPPEITRKNKEWSQSLHAVAFSADGKMLATRADGASFRGGFDDETALWDIATGKLVRTFTGHENEVWWGVRAADGSIVVLNSDDPSSIVFESDGNESKKAILRAIPNQDAAYLQLTSGHIEFFGADACAARTFPICRVGALPFPFEVCEERFYAPGLLAKVHSGDMSYLEPENAPPPMKCSRGGP